MKQRNKERRLAGAQKAYDSMDQRYKDAHKRPGSVKHK